MQSIAPPGGLVVGEPPIARRDDTSIREPEPVTVKGKAEPLRVWAVDAVARRRFPSRADAHARPSSDGPGTHPPRGAVRPMSARDPRPGWSRSSASPGIGKTRLVRDLRDRVLAHERAHDVEPGTLLPSLTVSRVTFAPLEEVVREATCVKVFG